MADSAYLHLITALGTLQNSKDEYKRKLKEYREASSEPEDPKVTDFYSSSIHAIDEAKEFFKRFFFQGEPTHRHLAQAFENDSRVSSLTQKTRAWSLHHKFMGHVYSIDHETGLVKIKNTKQKTKHTLGISTVILQQFTGLADRFGTPIFEGDLVLHLHQKSFFSVSLIEFTNGMFAIKDERISDEPQPLCDKAIYCQVAGNIYENPETLK